MCRPFRPRLVASVLSLFVSAAALAQAPAQPAPPGPNRNQPADVAAPKIGEDGQPQKGFTDRHTQFVQRAKQGNVNVLFLGDSITAGWNGAGREVWRDKIEPLKPANFGIGGDRTQHVLWRITNGELDGISPKLAVLMIGTNNSGDNTAEQIAAGVEKIVRTLREKLPQTKVLVLGIFPRGDGPQDPKRLKVFQANEIVARLADGKNIHYLDIGKAFLTPDGLLTKEVSNDTVHLTGKGYQIWADAMLPKVKELMGPE